MYCYYYNERWYKFWDTMYCNTPLPRDCSSLVTAFAASWGFRSFFARQNAASNSRTWGACQFSLRQECAAARRKNGQLERSGFFPTRIRTHRGNAHRLKLKLANLRCSNTTHRRGGKRS